MALRRRTVQFSTFNNRDIHMVEVRWVFTGNPVSEVDNDMQLIILLFCIPLVHQGQATESREVGLLWFFLKLSSAVVSRLYSTHICPGSWGFNENIKVCATK